MEEGPDTRLPKATPHLSDLQPQTSPRLMGGLWQQLKGNRGPRGKHSVKFYSLSVIVIYETTGGLSAQGPCPTAAGFQPGHSSLPLEGGGYNEMLSNIFTGDSHKGGTQMNRRTKEGILTHATV